MIAERSSRRPDRQRVVVSIKDTVTISGTRQTSGVHASLLFLLTCLIIATPKLGSWSRIPFGCQLQIGNHLRNG